MRLQAQSTANSSMIQGLQKQISQNIKSTFATFGGSGGSSANANAAPGNFGGGGSLAPLMADLFIKTARG